MKVVVDRTKCQDHGQCVIAAPEVFAMDDNSKLVLLQEEPPESLREVVEDAADVCPEQAIRIED